MEVDAYKNTATCSSTLQFMYERLHICNTFHKCFLRIARKEKICYLFINLSDQLFEGVILWMPARVLEIFKVVGSKVRTQKSLATKLCSRFVVAIRHQLEKE